MTPEEYAAIINGSTDLTGTLDAALRQVITLMMKECADLQKSRHARTINAHRAVFHEVDDKWMALIDLCPGKGLRANGFSRALRVLNPEAWEVTFGSMATDPDPKVEI